MHKLVMHGLSKEKNLLLIRKWEWLQRQLEEKHKWDCACYAAIKMSKARHRPFSSFPASCDCLQKAMWLMW